MFKNEFTSYDDIKRESYSLKVMSTLSSFKEKIRSNFKEIVDENKLKFEKENKKEENKLLKQQICLEESEKIRLIKIASSLIVDFLKKYRLLHSTSVFTTEIGIPDLLTEQELSGLFKINYDNLSKRESSILGCVLLTMLNFLSNKKNCTGTQTEMNEEMEMKFKLIDQKYGINERSSSKEINLKEDEKLKIKRILEKEMKIQLQNEIILFKEIESNNIRVQEQKTYKKKLDELKEKLQVLYEEKERNLIKKEREFETKVNEREQELDRMIYENNEKLEYEISRLREKESADFIKNEAETRKIRNLEEKLKSQEKELIIKFKEIENIKKETKEFYDKEIENFKQAFIECHRKEKNGYREGKELFEEQTKLNEEYKCTLKTIDKEKDILKQEINDLKKLLEDKKFIYSNTLNECNLLKEEIKSIHSSFKSTSRKLDMKVLKNLNLKEQISMLKNSFDKVQSDYQSRKEEMEKIINELRKNLEEKNRETHLIIEEHTKEHEKLHQFYQDSLKNEENRYEKLKEDNLKEKKLLQESVNKFKDLYAKSLKTKVDEQYEKLDKNIAKIDEDLFKKTGKVIENKLFTEHMNIYDDMKYNDRLVNWRLLEIKSEENMKKLPFAFENKLVTDSYLTKKLDEMQQINVLVDNYTKVKNFNSQDIIENISSKLKEDIKELKVNSKSLMSKTQGLPSSWINEKGNKGSLEISSTSYTDQINTNHNKPFQEQIINKLDHGSIKGTDTIKRETINSGKGDDLKLKETPIIMNNEEHEIKESTKQTVVYFSEKLTNSEHIKNNDKMDSLSKEALLGNDKNKNPNVKENNTEPSILYTPKNENFTNLKKDQSIGLNASKLINTSLIKNQMCAIKEEDESKTLSQGEESLKVDNRVYLNENKFQNVQDNQKPKKLNKTNNEEIEEIYDQDFDDYTEQSMAHRSNYLQSNEFNALKNISHIGVSGKILDSAYKVKPSTNHNISKTSSVNIDKLLQSKHSNYSYKFDEIDSFESSKGYLTKNEISKAKTESEIIEEVCVV